VAIVATAATVTAVTKATEGCGFIRYFEVVVNPHGGAVRTGFIFVSIVLSGVPGRSLGRHIKYARSHLYYGTTEQHTKRYDNTLATYFSPTVPASSNLHTTSIS
jgi:hypothetical protein